MMPPCAGWWERACQGGGTLGGSDVLAAGRLPALLLRG